jgi:hypothetical protein
MKVLDIKKLLPESKDTLITACQTFASYKSKEAELKQLASTADDAKHFILSTLAQVDKDAADRNFNLLIGNEHAAFNISGKTSRESYHTVEAIDAEIKKLQALKDRVVAKEVIVKTASKFTFSIAQVKAE